MKFWDIGKLRIVIYYSGWKWAWWREAPKWELSLGVVELRWRVHKR